MIRVLPLDQAGSSPSPPVGVAQADPLAWASHRRFMPSGRSGLDAVLDSLELEPDDEVMITNSSGQRYISPCVTCVVFNHCQPSRVLTDRTRAIVVIHEYGYPHPELIELCAVAGDRAIPLIEDCVHSLDSTLDGAPLGSFGDYAIFSLSKVLPVPAGGILVGSDALPDRRPETEPEQALERERGGAGAQAAYREHLPALAEYARRRRRNSDAVRRSFPDLPLLLEPGPGVTPFYIGLLTPDAPEIRRRSSAVEWGSTLRSDLLLVTTNPFVETDVLVTALNSAFGRTGGE
jgi:hypothetical protein